MDELLDQDYTIDVKQSRQRGELNLYWAGIGQLVKNCSGPDPAFIRLGNRTVDASRLWPTSRKYHDMLMGRPATSPGYGASTAHSASTSIPSPSTIWRPKNSRRTSRAPGRSRLACSAMIRGRRGKEASLRRVAKFKRTDRPTPDELRQAGVSADQVRALKNT